MSTWSVLSSRISISSSISSPDSVTFQTGLMDYLTVETQLLGFSSSYNHDLGGNSSLLPLEFPPFEATMLITEGTEIHIITKSLTWHTATFPVGKRFFFSCIFPKLLFHCTQFQCYEYVWGTYALKRGVPVLRFTVSHLLSIVISGNALWLPEAVPNRFLSNSIRQLRSDIAKVHPLFWVFFKINTFNNCYGTV